MKLPWEGNTVKVAQTLSTKTWLMPLFMDVTTYQHYTTPLLQNTTQPSTPKWTATKRFANLGLTEQRLYSHCSNFTFWKQKIN